MTCAAVVHYIETFLLNIMTTDVEKSDAETLRQRMSFLVKINPPVLFTYCIRTGTRNGPQIIPYAVLTCRNILVSRGQPTTIHSHNFTLNFITPFSRDSISCVYVITHPDTTVMHINYAITGVWAPFRPDDLQLTNA